MIHWFDLFVIFFISVSSVWSFFRGFSREAYSFFSLVAGYFGATQYYQQVSLLLTDFIPGKTLAEIVAFVSVYMLTLLLVTIFGIALRKILNVSDGLSSFDKFAGIPMGAAKAIFILSIIVYPLSFLPALEKDMASGAKSVPLLIAVSTKVIKTFSPEISEKIDKAKQNEKLKKLDKKGLKKLGKKIGKAARTIAEKAKEGKLESKELENLIEQNDN